MITTELVTLPASGPEQPYLSCRVAGPQGAPLLIFLHGFPEAAFVWDELLTHFADRYRCVAPNLRGYPGSYAPADPKAYRANIVLGDLIGLIQQCAATPATGAAPSPGAWPPWRRNACSAWSSSTRPILACSSRPCATTPCNKPPAAT